MKRKDLERRLRAAGATKIGTKGKHDKWGCPCGQHTAPVPRHTEIAGGTIDSIAAQLGCITEGVMK